MYTPFQRHLFEFWFEHDLVPPFNLLARWLDHNDFIVIDDLTPIVYLMDNQGDLFCLLARYCQINDGIYVCLKEPLRHKEPPLEENIRRRILLARERLV